VFEEYQAWCKAYPIKRNKTMLDAPLTIQGFCRFSGISRSTFMRWRVGDRLPKSLEDTVEKISATIDEHLITRALISVYRENLVARMTGQSDKRQQHVITESIESRLDPSRLSHTHLVMLRALMTGNDDNGAIL